MFQEPSLFPHLSVRGNLLYGAPKAAATSIGFDEVVELLGLWHQARRSLLKSQQHLLNEAEDMLQAMPEAIRDRLPASKAVWPRLRALTTLSDETSGEDWDAPTALRLRLLGEHARAGCVVFKPRGVFHAFWNPGVTTARYLDFITPAGFEECLQELGAQAVPAEIVRAAAAAAVKTRIIIWGLTL